jgi:predicted nuclease of predicted toxin-antitoxin system
MKLLLDENFPLFCVGELVAAGHEVRLSAEWRKEAPDHEVLRYALKTESVLLTMDKDFGRLAVVERQMHVGIILADQLPPTQLVRRVLTALEQYSSELQRGALVTIKRRKTRIRISNGISG